MPPNPEGHLGVFRKGRCRKQAYHSRKEGCCQGQLGYVMGAGDKDAELPDSSVSQTSAEGL